MQVEETVEVTLGRESVAKVVELPIPDIPGRHIPVEDDSTRNGVAGVVHGTTVTVAWRADAAGEAVELWPLELTDQKMRDHGAKLRIQSTFRVLPNCVTVCATDAAIVLDFITDVGILFTVVLDPQWLMDSSTAVPTATAFTRSFRPSTFDAAPPRLLKAIDTSTLVVALVDGTLVRVDRTTVLAAPSITTFTEHYSTGIAAGLARVFRAGTDRVPGRSELTFRTVVAMEIVGRNVVTHSVDGSLRLWSLGSTACIQVVPAPSNTPLRTRPAALLASYGNRILVSQAGEVRHYELLSTESLKRLDDVSAAIPAEMRGWFITGLVLREDFSALIAFRTNLSARIFVVHENRWTQIGGYNLASHLDLPADAGVQNVTRRILQSSSDVLRAALEELAPEHIAKYQTISDSIVRDVITDLAAGADERTQWLRLDTLCREIEVANAELLTVATTSEAPSSLVWTIRASCFTLLSCDVGARAAEPREGSEALETANKLLGLLPGPVLSKISGRLLSSDLLLDRVDDVCELVRPYLDSTQLNEIGRTLSKQLAPAIGRYAHAYAPGPEEGNNNAGANIKLSALGSLAVTELVRNYATQQSHSFLLLATLAVIGLVEGWFADVGDAEPLRETLACHQRLAFIAALDAKHLQPEIDSAQLETFGLQAARELAAKVDPLAVLATFLPLSALEANRSIYDAVDTLASIVENSVPASELVTLRGLAALAAHQDQRGEELLRRVSLARKWPARLAPAPVNSAGWFTRVAQYAKAVGMRDVALRFARTGATLHTREEAGGEDVAASLDVLFDLSLGAGDVSMAYTALVRRYAHSPEGSEASLGSFIDTMARRDHEGAPKLIASLPFIGLTTQLNRVLTEVPMFGSVPSYKLRYAWHVEHEDYAGAALALYEHIKSSRSDAIRKNALYTICLNSLALQKQDSRWVIYENRVVTYDDIRAESDSLLEGMAKTAMAL